MFNTEFLEKIGNLVNGQAFFSEKENRIYVKFVGIKNASVLKNFMHKNNFNDVFGAYDDGVYTLGFARGEGF